MQNKIMLWLPELTLSYLVFVGCYSIGYFSLFGVGYISFFEISSFFSLSLSVVFLVALLSSFIVFGFLFLIRFANLVYWLILSKSYFFGALDYLFLRNFEGVLLYVVSVLLGIFVLSLFLPPLDSYLFAFSIFLSVSFSMVLLIFQLPKFKERVGGSGLVLLLSVSCIIASFLLGRYVAYDRVLGRYTECVRLLFDGSKFSGVVLHYDGANYLLYDVLNSKIFFLDVRGNRLRSTDFDPYKWYRFLNERKSKTLLDLDKYKCFVETF